MKRGIIVVAKEPVAGKVKTRLVPPLTYEQAAELYRAFLLDALNQYKTLENVDTVLFYTPETSKTWFEQNCPDCRLIPQYGTDLGEKMASVFRQLFIEGYDQLVIIGTDHPTLPTDFIRQAFDKLADGIDVVIGPSNDGGYYLMGLCQSNDEIFKNIQWSTSSVFEETVKRIESEELTVYILPEWYDVDTGSDLERLKQELSNPINSLKHTQSVLDRFSV